MVVCMRDGQLFSLGDYLLIQMDNSSAGLVQPLIFWDDSSDPISCGTFYLTKGLRNCSWFIDTSMVITFHYIVCCYNSLRSAFRGRKVNLPSHEAHAPLHPAHVSFIIHCFRLTSLDLGPRRVSIDLQWAGGKHTSRGSATRTCIMLTCRAARLKSGKIGLSPPS